MEINVTELLFVVKPIPSIVLDSSIYSPASCRCEGKCKTKINSMLDTVRYDSTNSVDELGWVVVYERQPSSITCDPLHYYYYVLLCWSLHEWNEPLGQFDTVQHCAIVMVVVMVMVMVMVIAIDSWSDMDQAIGEHQDIPGWHINCLMSACKSFPCVVNH